MLPAERRDMVAAVDLTKDLKPAGEVEGQAGDIGRLDLGDQLDVVHEFFLVR
jgi:hypothetical protein